MVQWEELPQEILELIVGRLAMEDFLAVRRVCTAWRSAAAKERYNAKSKPPWLIIHPYRRTADFSIHSTGRIYAVRFLGFLEYEGTLSTPGWILVLEGDKKYHIFNPLSCVSIELPALREKLRQELHRIDAIALSSSPSLSRSYTVMISYYTLPESLPGFAFLRSGEEAWTLVSCVTTSYWCTARELIYYDGLFVALDEESRISTLNERENRMESRLVLGLKHRVDGVPYLVECSGSLLVAWTIWGEKYGPPVTEIRVFRVDLEKGTAEEVKSLGNVSLFLNRNSSFSVEFNTDSCLHEIKPNRVYFIDYEDDEDDEDDKIKSYSMEDGNFDSSSSYIQQAQWFQPDF